MSLIDLRFSWDIFAVIISPFQRKVDISIDTYSKSVEVRRAEVGV